MHSTHTGSSSQMLGHTRSSMSMSASQLGSNTAQRRKSCLEKFEIGYYVVYPHSSFVLPLWDLGLTALTVIVAFTVPYEIGFELFPPYTGSKVRTKEIRRLAIAVDVFFLFDVFLQLFVSYYNHSQKRWVRRPWGIVRAYMAGNFTSDMVSVVPYMKLADILDARYGEKMKFLGVLSLFGLLRLRRVGRLIERYEARLSYQYSFVNMIKLMVLLLLTVHWAACFWGFVLCVERFFGIREEYTWFSSVIASKPAFAEHQLSSAGSWEIYTASLYWSVMTTTSIGYGDITAMNQVEALSCTITMLTTGVIWAHIIGNVCTIAFSFNEQSTDYERQIDSLNHWMKFIKLPEEFRMELRSFFMAKRSVYQREKQIQLLKAMSPDLQHRLAHHMQSNWLERIWFFRDIPDNGFMVGMFERFNVAVYPPRELIKLPSSLCNLQQGMVMRGSHIHFPGDFWGVHELLLSNKRLLKSVTPVALSYAELQHITRFALEELSADYPEQRRQIRRATVWAALKQALVANKGHLKWEDVPQEASPGRAVQTLVVEEHHKKMLRANTLTLGFCHHEAESPQAVSLQGGDDGSSYLMRAHVREMETRVANLEQGMTTLLDTLVTLRRRSDKEQTSFKL